MMIADAIASFPRSVPKPQGLVARQGLSYQGKVFRELKKTLPEKGFLVEHVPWFRYRPVGENSDKFCSPDILITDLEDQYVIIVEVKLSWVPNVLEKLRDLYCPVVSRALQIPTKPLVIAKNSAPGAPSSNTRLGYALMAQEPFLLWRGDSPILL